MPRLAIIGYGKMGRAVEQVARERGWDIAGVIDPQVGGCATTVSRETLGGADVAIEFTTPDTAVANIRATINAGCPIVVGTTGWYGSLDEISTAVRAANTGLLWAPNFAIGVTIMLMLAAEAGRVMATTPGFEAHLVETHHSAKKDAPSGTAQAIVGAVRAMYGRDIPTTSVRVGHVPGTHELIFDGPYEQISLTHLVRDRRVFADGAERAARWLVGRTGVFRLADALAKEGR